MIIAWAEMVEVERVKSSWTLEIKENMLGYLGYEI